MAAKAQRAAWPRVLHNEGCRRLAQLAQRSFGVDLNFVDARGWLQGVPPGRFFNPANGLSALVSASDAGFKAKRDTAFELAAEVQSTRLPKRKVTVLGTALAAVPILSEGVYVGYVYADDFFAAEALATQHTRFQSFLTRHFADGGVAERLAEIPVLTETDVARLLDLMEIVAETVGAAWPTSSVERRDGFVNAHIVGRSKAVTELIETLARIAGSEASVLITGESGVGKELVARTLHDNSRRRSREYVAVNCGAFHEQLLESELFGHVKGAFTGATDDRIGYFERAHGGTLFLDEIGETALAMQVKMLRFLQESTFTPVGASRERTADVRVIAATNRDLRQMLRKATFREDLYYRLRVIQVAVPPLRERQDDIPVLVDFFLRKHATDASAPAALAAATAARLAQYDWPGNVRQLENEIRRLSVLGKGEREIGPEHLSPEILKEGRIRAGHFDVDERLKRTLAAREREQIAQGLARTGGNKTRLARDLGMSRVTLAKKIKEYSLEAPLPLKKSS